MWPRCPSPSRGGASRSVVVLAVLLVAATCRGDEPAPPGPTAAPERPAARGTIRVAYPEEPATLSPVEGRTAATADLLRPVLPSFFLVTPDLRYRPYLLAEEPEVAERGRRTIVGFRIRRDATWSDGRPITVEDVAFTARAMARPRLPTAVPDGFQHLRRVVEVSAKEGRLVLDQFRGWRDLFSAGRFVLPAHAAASPRDVAGWDEGPPVTAGPFRLESWRSGRSVTFEPDPGFWGPAPLVERLEVVFVPDATTALQLLDRGLVDVAAPYLGVAWSARLERAGAVVSAAYGPDVVHLAINTERVSDPQVRRGIAGIVDRERFVEVVLAGEARVAEGVLVPEQAGAVPAWQGYGGGGGSVQVSGELVLAFPRGELTSLLARFLRQEGERAGVDVELVGLDAEIFHETWLPERRYDLAIWEVRGGPEPWLSRWFAGDGGASASGLEDAALDDLLREVDAGSGSALTAAQRRLSALAPVLPLLQPQVAVGARPGVSGPAANPSVEGVLWNTWEWAKAAEMEEEAA